MLTKVRITSQPKIAEVLRYRTHAGAGIGSCPRRAKGGFKKTVVGDGSVG